MPLICFDEIESRVSAVAEDLWCGACPSGGTCTGAGLTCSNNVCVCNAGSMVDLTAGTCSGEQLLVVTLL